jgi:pilus assembly protein CpaE
LSRQFSNAQVSARAFDVVADWTEYPATDAMESRIRQFQPDVALVDLSQDLQRALDLIQYLAARRPSLVVVGIDTANQPESILLSMRAGANEFLYAPFSSDLQTEAVARITRLMPAQADAAAQRGKLVVFSSSKPGSGASFLATQTARALQRITRGRVLLADFDVWEGTIGLLFKLDECSHLLDALGSVNSASGPTLESMVSSKDGLDILPAPSSPQDQAVDPGSVRKLLEHARSLYDWIVIDLPPIFERLSLQSLPEADYAFLISTTDLPSLHLTRKAVSFLAQLGLGQGNFHVVVNRVGRRDGLGLDAMAKIFNARIYASFPNDYLSLQLALSSGSPIAEDGALAQAIDQFTHRICRGAEVAPDASSSRQPAAKLQTTGRA